MRNVRHEPEARLLWPAFFCSSPRFMYTLICIPFLPPCLLVSPFMFIPFPSLAHSCVSANERGTVWIRVRARLCVYRGVEGFLLISSHFAFIFADAAHSKNSRLSSFFLEARMRVDNDNNKAKTVSSTLAATKLLAINKGLLLGHVFRVIPRWKYFTAFLFCCFFVLILYFRTVRLVRTHTNERVCLLGGIFSFFSLWAT